MAYDALGNVVSRRDTGGFVTTYVYDSERRLASQTGPDGVTNKFAYDAVGNQTSQTMAAGSARSATTSWTYDASNYKLTQTDALGGVTSYAYDQNHNLVAETNPLGFVTLYQYDADNRLIKETDALGYATTYAYDLVGNMVGKDEPGNDSITYVYDADNRLISQTDADGVTSSWTYDADGQQLTETLGATASSSGVTTSTVYDAGNRVIAVIDGAGYRTDFVNDAVGNVLVAHHQLDHAGALQSTHYFYDALNRNVATRNAEGYLTTTAYDAAGNVAQTAAYVTRVALPASGLPVPNAGDSVAVTSYTYDGMGRQLSATDASGAVYAYAYDEQGMRIASVSYQGTDSQRTMRMEYDLLGRKTADIDAAGKVTRHVYDAVSNRTSMIDGEGTPGARSTTFVYDGMGRVTSETNALGYVTLRVYGSNGDMLRETSAAGIAGHEKTIVYGYDNKHQVTFTANLADSPDGTAGSVTRYSAFQYDALGNRTLVRNWDSLNGALDQKFAYDAMRNVESSTDATGLQTLNKYDGAGNLLSVTESGGGAQRTTSYTYDLENRLVGITDPMGGKTTFTLDYVGNRVAVSDALTRSTTLTFDLMGRMLTTLTPDGQLTTNVYDLCGMLVSSTVSALDGSDARTTVSTYDVMDRQVSSTNALGYTATAAYNIFGEQVAGTTGAYLRLPGQPGYDAALAALANPASNTTAYDALGRSIRTVDAAGMVTLSQYDARGNRTGVTIAADTALARTSSMTYDLHDRLVSSTSAQGAVIRYEYAAAQVDKPSREIRENRFGTALVTSYTYDLNGRMLSATVGGVARSMRYNAFGEEVANVTGAPGDEHGVLREYNANGNVLVETDGQGNRTDFTYDAVGNARTRKDANGNLATSWFDSANRLVALLDPMGYLTTYRYDLTGNMAESRQFAAVYSGSAGLDQAPAPKGDALHDRVVVAEYDQLGRQVALTAADGSRSAYVYDAAGNRVRETTRVGQPGLERTAHASFDAANRATNQTGVDGAQSSLQYDVLGNLVAQQVQPDAGAQIRATTYSYDLDNRRVGSSFDATGLAISSSTIYDDLNNVLETRDGEGRATFKTYDDGARLATVKDGHGVLTNSYGYDNHGNVTSENGAQGDLTYSYDKNNRRIGMQFAHSTQFTIKEGERFQGAGMQFQYDGIGNLVQSTDANGFVTTNYYDAAQRLVAQLDGDNVLHEYSYDGFGQKVGERLYMTRLDSTAHDMATLPEAPAGAVRNYSFEYDLNGRMTRKIYPQVTLTTLTGVDANTPGSVSALVTPEERYYYDAYGNLAESVGVDGGRTLAWYDSMNRVTAQVDPAGYLTQFSYDRSGNVLEKRVYTQALSLATLDRATVPAAPSDAVALTSYVYDLANRVVEVRTPAVQTIDQDTRVTTLQSMITRFAYDKAGNVTQTIKAAGTPSEQIENALFDARNRRIGVVDAASTLTLTRYDAHGRTLATVHFANPVNRSALAGGAAFSYAGLYALVNPGAADQGSSFAYNARGQLITQEDAVGGVAIASIGETDFTVTFGNVVTKQFQYDAAGNRTLTQDAAGFTIQAAFDAAGRAVRAIHADGSGTRQFFDAAGNTILSFTGEMDNQAAPATQLSVKVGAQLTVGYNVTAGMTSYVLWDTVSHATMADYTNRAAANTALGSTSGAASVPRPAAGTAIFYRVVTQDAAGNQVFTAEQKVVMPPAVDDVQVSRPAPGKMLVRVKFAGTVLAPKMAYGPNGATNTTVAMMSMVTQPDGFPRDFDHVARWAMG